MNSDTPGHEGPILTENGITFRDLNKNGRLDPYEDRRRPIEERIDDLLSQMTLEEKAGMMMHCPIGMNPDGSLAEEIAPFNPSTTSDMVQERLITEKELKELETRVDKEIRA